MKGYSHMKTILEVREIVAGYNGTKVIDGVSLSLGPGEIGCLLGASGSGKTTFLRLLAGFQPLAAGEITLAGEVVAAPGRFVPPESRQVGMLFQDYGLFPHLTVAANVAFGLHRLPKAAKTERVRELLALVGLEAKATAYPHELSGGQQQRVALARALAPRPRLLLLDEPFSNLDAGLRERLSLEVRRIIKAEKITALMVTHSQVEAFAMADKVGVLLDGRIQQWDAPEVLYHHPATPAVAAFVGEGALIAATITATGEVVSELGCFRCPQPWPANTRIHMLVRPEDLAVSEMGKIRARVAAKVYRGAHVLYPLELAGGTKVFALVPSHQRYQVGDEVAIHPRLEDIVVFTAEESCGVDPSITAAGRGQEFEIHCDQDAHSQDDRESFILGATSTGS